MINLLKKTICIYIYIYMIHYIKYHIVSMSADYWDTVMLKHPMIDFTGCFAPCKTKKNVTIHSKYLFKI